MKKQIIILGITALTVGGCGQSNTKKQSETANSDTIITENLVEENKKNEDNSNIIFSTEDIQKSKFEPFESIKKKTSYSEYYDDGVVNTFLVLPKYKKYDILINCMQGDENRMYYLCVVKDGKLKPDRRDALDITLDWSEPDNEVNVYCKKTFKIYEDYTIEIHTENGNYGKIQRYTKYYKINDKGDFYEVESKE